jgi:hypothetical protein
MTKFISIDKDTQEKKETVFTHHLDGKKFVETKGTTKQWDEVIFLKHRIHDDDIFACFSKDGTFNIYLGTKGDEFN